MKFSIKIPRYLLATLTGLFLLANASSANAESILHQFSSGASVRVLNSQYGDVGQIYASDGRPFEKLTFFTNDFAPIELKNSEGSKPEEYVVHLNWPDTFVMSPRPGRIYISQTNGTTHTIEQNKVWGYSGIVSTDNMQVAILGSTNYFSHHRIIYIVDPISKQITKEIDLDLDSEIKNIKSLILNKGNGIHSYLIAGGYNNEMIITLNQDFIKVRILDLNRITTSKKNRRYLFPVALKNNAIVTLTRDGSIIFIPSNGESVQIKDKLWTKGHASMIKMITENDGEYAIIKMQDRSKNYEYVPVFRVDLDGKITELYNK